MYLITFVCVNAFINLRSDYDGDLQKSGEFLSTLQTAWRTPRNICRVYKKLRISFFHIVCYKVLERDEKKFVRVNYI